MKITNTGTPNTTIILPGKCNAKCGFCFWNRDFGKIEPGDGYLGRVFANLKSLPVRFSTVSISGGEPTLSPLFAQFLSRLARHRYLHRLDRIVLTTNGANLDKFIVGIGCVADHLNISRHGIGTEENQNIFGTASIPSDYDLAKSIKRIHSETQMDVTLNCVVEPDVSVGFCMEYIKYAKSLGADAVSFRKIAGDTDPTDAEILMSAMFGIVTQSDCPVCRGLIQSVDGFEVRWKCGTLEPSLDTGGIYEAIIHPDGNLYRDWSMGHQMKFTQIVPPSQQQPTNYYRESSASGCGSSGCGGGC